MDLESRKVEQFTTVTITKWPSALILKKWPSEKRRTEMRDLFTTVTVTQWPSAFDSEKAAIDKGLCYSYSLCVCVCVCVWSQRILHRNTCSLCWTCSAIGELSGASICLMANCPVVNCPTPIQSPSQCLVATSFTEIDCFRRMGLIELGGWKCTIVLLVCKDCIHKHILMKC